MPASSPSVSPNPDSETIDRLRRLIARMESRIDRTATPTAQHRMPIEDVVDGRYLETPHGPLFTTWTETPLSARRGRRENSLVSLLSPIPGPLARIARDDSLEGIDPAGFLYLDTETTGLATTSGTFAFLVGVGFVDGSLFIVEQYFARDYDEELALLWTLAERLRQHAGIVTYNGRGFDIPLLQARFATNRWFDPPIPAHHLDMLLPARKLWRARNVGCRLSSLERDVLGVERELDVPGAMIPDIYFTALRSANAMPLRPVFEHNVHDILSLAGLTARAVEHLSGEVSPSGIGEDVLSVARILERLNVEEAVTLYAAASEAEFRSEGGVDEALCRLGILHRRLGNRDEAARAFARIAEEGGVLRAFGLIELAKHLEHAQRAFEEAHEMTVRAWDALQELEAQDRAPRGEFRITAKQVEARLARLRARVAGEAWRHSS